MLVLTAEGPLGALKNKNDFNIREVHNSEELLGVNVVAIIRIDKEDSLVFLQTAVRRMASRIGAALVYPTNVSPDFIAANRVHEYKSFGEFVNGLL